MICETKRCDRKSTMVCLGVHICDKCFFKLSDGDVLDTERGLIRRDSKRLVIS